LPPKVFTGGNFYKESSHQHFALNKNHFGTIISKIEPQHTANIASREVMVNLIYPIPLADCADFVELSNNANPPFKWRMTTWNISRVTRFLY